MEILMTAVTYFNRGGMVMYLLLLASIGAGTVIVERFRYYRQKQVDFKLHYQALKQNVQAHTVAEIAALYGKKATALDKVTAAGFRAKANGRNVSLAVESAAQLEAAQLKKGLPLLGTLVTLAPILGLMGTVIGMMQSFSVFNLQSGSPMAITGGVGEALIATVTGLMVATFALLGHSYFGYRLDSIVTDMERLGSLLEDRLAVLPQQNAKERGKAHDEAA